MTGYSSNSCGNCGYSNLESAVNSYSASSAPSYSSGSSYADSNSLSYLVEAAAITNPLKNIAKYDFNVKKDNYGGISLENYNAKKSITSTYSHIHDNFLMPNRPKSIFVGDAAEIKEFIEDAFKTTIGREFPDDIIVHVVDEKIMKKAHSMFGSNWNNGIQGFAINRKERGLSSEIFIKKGELDRIMLTIGHEIGHVLTIKKDNALDEEAKAFAFSLAWMKAIKQKNIANLATSISLSAPAMNGIHNTALDFVLDQRINGKEALDIYYDIIAGLIKIAG
ncbi:hypothetical protein KY342_02865 [Candidatus Woesearchaeota archaeon]|nr:hypothetical protein [Candidatus Woesearchaeota archaeon]